MREREIMDLLTLVESVKPGFDHTVDRIESLLKFGDEHRQMVTFLLWHPEFKLPEDLQEKLGYPYEQFKAYDYLREQMKLALEAQRAEAMREAE